MFQFIKSLWDTVGNQDTFIPHDSVFTLIPNNVYIPPPKDILKINAQQMHTQGIHELWYIYTPLQ